MRSAMAWIGRVLLVFCEAQRQGVTFLDGVAALRAVADPDVPALFLDAGVTQHPAAAGHYTVKGNRWVAEWLLASLRERGIVTQ